MTASPPSTLSSPSARAIRYQRMVDELRAQIHSGKFKAGERLPSFADLQTQFNAAPSTVSRALMVLEQEHLIVREQGRGIFVAPSRRRSARGIIGVSGTGFGFTGNFSYWGRLFGGIRATTEQHNRHVLHLKHTSTSGWENADGILVCDWSTRKTLRLVPPGLPCVSVLGKDKEFASVSADDYQGGVIATEHLLALGHRRVACLFSKGEMRSAQRLNGYRDALQAAQIAPRSNWLRQLKGWLEYGDDFIETGYETMRDWLSENWSTLGCTALLAQNDETAIGAISALREAGFAVPHQVSVVGFDGTEVSEYCTPRLTTIVVPLREIGSVAVELLLEQITANQVSCEHRVLPVQLKVAESTAAPPK